MKRNQRFNHPYKQRYSLSRNNQFVKPLLKFCEFTADWAENLSSPKKSLVCDGFLMECGKSNDEVFDQNNHKVDRSFVDKYEKKEDCGGIKRRSKSFAGSFFWDDGKNLYEKLPKAENIKCDKGICEDNRRAEEGNITERYSSDKTLDNNKNFNISKNGSQSNENVSNKNDVHKTHRELMHCSNEKAFEEQNSVEIMKSVWDEWILRSQQYLPKNVAKKQLNNINHQNPRNEHQSSKTANPCYHCSDTNYQKQSVIDQQACMPQKRCRIINHYLFKQNFDKPDINAKQSLQKIKMQSFSSQHSLTTKYSFLTHHLPSNYPSHEPPTSHFSSSTYHLPSNHQPPLTYSSLTRHPPLAQHLSLNQSSPTYYPSPIHYSLPIHHPSSIHHPPSTRHHVKPHNPQLRKLKHSKLRPNTSRPLNRLKDYNLRSFSLDHKTRNSSRLNRSSFVNNLNFSTKEGIHHTSPQFINVDPFSKLFSNKNNENVNVNSNNNNNNNNNNDWNNNSSGTNINNTVNCDIKTNNDNIKIKNNNNTNIDVDKNNHTNKNINNNNNNDNIDENKNNNINNNKNKKNNDREDTLEAVLESESVLFLKPGVSAESNNGSDAFKDNNKSKSLFENSINMNNDNNNNNDNSYNNNFINSYNKNTHNDNNFTNNKDNYNNSSFTVINKDNKNNIEKRAQMLGASDNEANSSLLVTKKKKKNAKEFYCSNECGGRSNLFRYSDNYECGGGYNDDTNDDNEDVDISYLNQDNSGCYGDEVDNGLVNDDDGDSNFGYNETKGGVEMEVDAKNILGGVKSNQNVSEPGDETDLRDVLL